MITLYRVHHKLHSWSAIYQWHNIMSLPATWRADTQLTEVSLLLALLVKISLKKIKIYKCLTITFDHRMILLNIKMNMQVRRRGWYASTPSTEYCNSTCTSSRLTVYYRTRSRSSCFLWFPWLWRVAAIPKVRKFCDLASLYIFHLFSSGLWKFNQMILSGRWA